MDLLQLRYFIAVAETEHVTHAAESLNVAQPALTKTIKKLEKEIGFPLLKEKDGELLCRNAANICTITSPKR